MIKTCYFPSLPITVHKDQDQEKPLYGALEKGCKYIEFDLHLAENGDLLVGHDEGAKGKTLENIYLNPLLALNNAGSLGGEFNLIVDVKTKAEETFVAIKNLLEKYSSMLTMYYEGTGLIQRQIKVIISGNRDKAAIEKARPRLAFYDGRIGDLCGSLDSRFMPLISENWNKILLPRPRMADGCSSAAHLIDLDDSIKTTIEDKVTTVAQAGVVFRPWAMPEEEHTWQLLAHLRERGFVYNTDYPERLVNFFARLALEQKSSAAVTNPDT